jgi:hypothetical protein
LESHAFGTCVPMPLAPSVMRTGFPFNLDGSRGLLKSVGGLSGMSFLPPGGTVKELISLCWFYLGIFVGE